MKLYDARPLRNCDANGVNGDVLPRFSFIILAAGQRHGSWKNEIAEKSKKKTGFRFSFKAYGSAVERFVCNFCETLGKRNGHWSPCLSFRDFNPFLGAQ